MWRWYRGPRKREYTQSRLRKVRQTGRQMDKWADELSILCPPVSRNAYEWHRPEELISRRPADSSVSALWWRRRKPNVESRGPDLTNFCDHLMSFKCGFFQRIFLNQCCFQHFGGLSCLTTTLESSELTFLHLTHTASSYISGLGPYTNLKKR